MAEKKYDMMMYGAGNFTASIEDVEMESLERKIEDIQHAINNKKDRSFVFQNRDKTSTTVFNMDNVIAVQIKERT